MKIETTYQNLRDAAKAVLNWKFLVLNIYIGGGEISNKERNFVSKRVRKKNTHTHTKPKIST